MSVNKKYLLYFAAFVILLAVVIAVALVVSRLLPSHEEVETNLLPISIKRISLETYLPPKHARRSAAITKINADEILLLRGNRIYHFNVATETQTLLNITLPKTYNEPPETEQDKNKKIPRSLRYSGIKIIKTRNETFLLTSYNHWNQSQLCLKLKVAKVKIPNRIFPLLKVVKADDWKVFFQTPCRKKNIDGRMNGSRILLSKQPNHILLAIGVFTDESYIVSESPFGRVMEINVLNGKASTFARGLRNPQGFTRDNKGRLWTAGHGPKGGDEINLIEKGKHYGWPFVSYGTDYGKFTFRDQVIAGKHHSDNKYQKPAFSFIPAVGLSSLTLIADFAPQWNGDLLAAGLIGKSLYRLRIHKKHIVYAEQIKMPYRIRQVYNHGKGVILVLQEWNGGLNNFLYIIRPTAANPLYKINRASAQTQRAWENCLSCHTIDEKSDSRAPTLKNIFGRRMGDSDWSNYSPALESARGVWNEKNLKAFLKNPDDLIQNSSMPRPYLDEKNIDAIVKHLKKL